MDLQTRQRCQLVYDQCLNTIPATVDEQALLSDVFQVVNNLMAGHDSDLARDEARRMFTTAAAMLPHSDDTIYTCPRCRAEMPAWQQANHDDPKYGGSCRAAASYTLEDFAADLREITEPIIDKGGK